MVLWSSQISAHAQSYLSQVSGQAAYAQQLSQSRQMGFGGMMGPGGGGGAMVPPPAPAPPPISMMSAPGHMAGGMWGEQAAAGMMSSGMGAVNMGFAGAGLGLGMAGLAGGPVGWGAMAASLPLMAAGGAASVYGGAMQTGMMQQASLNGTLRNNFQFFGGGGPMGRGFSQSQMGAVGGTISQELRSNPFTSSGELNSLITGGAEAGMFTGVRDVQQFSQRFRTMLSTLKDLQKELGGTLSDAMGFIRESRQAGIFQRLDQTNFASEVRGAMATTGLSQGQLMGLATQGASMSRSVGGLGRQGARGALRTASTLGSAVQSGAVNEELLSEATGGLTGSDALQAMTARIMQQSASFSRRAMGRFSIFSMSNAEGTGLDRGMVDRFLAGDISVGDVQNRAHANVRGMGRARAINNEGRLRGALMEEGGLAGQLGMMRMMLGDRVMDQGDDMASLVMQRRFRMSRPEAEVMSSLMRNQSSIAEREGLDRVSSGRQQELATDLRQNRSLDSFFRHLEHSVQESTGMMSTRDVGRNFVTRISELADKVMNDILGVSTSRLSEGNQSALNRGMLGIGSSDDMRRIAQMDRGLMRGGVGDSTSRYFRSPLAGASVSERFRERGVNIEGMTGGDIQYAAIQAGEARQGRVRGADAAALGTMMSDRGGSLDRILTAETLAGGDARRFYRRATAGGASANAVDAFMQRTESGSQFLQDGVSAGTAMGVGGGRITRDMVMRDLGTIGSQIATSPVGFLGRIGVAGAALAGNGGIPRAARILGLESGNAMVTPQMNMDAYMAGGGSVGAQARRRLRAGRSGGLVDARRSRDGSNGTAADDEALTANIDQEQFAALRGSEEFQSAIHGVLEASGKEARTRAMRTLDTEVNATTGAGRAAALRIREHLRRGEDNTVRAWAQDPEQQEAQRAEYARWSGGLRNIAEGITDGPSGGLAERMRLQIGGAATLAGAGLGESGAQWMQNVQDQLMRLDPESEEYRSLSQQISATGTSGQELMRAAARNRQERETLSGRGRRGRRGAVEGALNRATGGTIGDMDIRVGGRRLTNISQIGQALTGRSGESIRGQIQEQLAASGVSEEDSRSLTHAMTAVASARNGTPEANRAAEELMRVERNSTSLNTVRTQALDRHQRQQNPLDHTRNQLLESMNNRLGQMVERMPGSSSGE